MTKEQDERKSGTDLHREKEPETEGGGARRLTLAEIERLPEEEFQALPEAERRRYFDHMNRENFPTSGEFYDSEVERESRGGDGPPEGDRGWTDDEISCESRPMPDPTPQDRKNDPEAVKPMGRPDLEGLFGEVISRYTRQQAMGDGVLVDVTATAREAGFKIPVALTAAVWAEYVAVPEGVGCQDEAGRLWDVLWMCRHGIGRGNRDQAEILFHLHVRNDDRGGEPPLVTLKAVCGPDDVGAPCVTIMLPDED